MSAAGIRAGKAYVELGANDSQLVAGLRRAQAKLKAFGTVVAGIGASMFAGGAAIATPLAMMTSTAAASGDELSKMADRSGASVEALSELRHAAGQSDVGLEQLAGGLKNMQKNLANGDKGFAELGLNINELLALEPDQQFEAIADRIAAIENPAARTAAAMSIFGKSGADLLPMMLGGAAGIQALRKEARDLGLQVSTRDAQAATLFGDTWANLMTVLKDVQIEVGNALIPTLTQIIQTVTPLVVSVARWISENRGAVVAVAAVAAAAIAFGSALTTVGGIVALAGPMLGGLVTVFGALVSPIGLVVVALGSATAAWLTFTDSGRATVAWVSTQLVSIAGIVSQTMQGVTDAIQGGNLQLAAKIAFTGIKLVIVELMNETAKLFGASLTDMLNGLKGFLGAANSILQQLNKQTFDSDMIDIALKGVAVGTNVGLGQFASSVDPAKIREDLSSLTAQAATEKQAKQSPPPEEKPKPKLSQNPLKGSGSVVAGVAGSLAAMLKAGVKQGGDALKSAMNFLDSGIQETKDRSGGAAFGTFSAAQATQNYGAGNLQQQMANSLKTIAGNTDPKNQRQPQVN